MRNSGSTRTPFGPIFGDKATSNELNAFRNQTCETAGGGGGGGNIVLPGIVPPGGGGGGGAVTLPAIVLPNGAVVLPGIVPPGGGGGGGAVTLPAIVLPNGTVVLPGIVPPGGGAVTLPAILPGGGAVTLPAIVLPDGSIKLPDGTVVPPGSGGGTVTPPAFVPGGGGGDGGTGGGGGGPVDNSVFHRQLARLLGTEFAARPDLIADAVQCGLQQKSGTADGITFAAMGSRWCAWTSPRQVNYKDTRNGVKFAGTLRDIAFGLDYRVTPDLVVGLAVTAQDADVSLEGLEVSLRQSGIGAGPYLGWRIRPTTIFDVWVAYTHLDRSFDIIGITASAPVDRTTITANLTEFITTPWMRIIPRLTYFQQQDRAQGFTTNTGFTVVGSPYDYSFMEGSVELNRDILFTNWVLTPFVRATARYYTQRLVEQVNTIDDNVLDLERWQGQLRGGLRAQFGPQFQLSVSGGYLSLGTEGVDAWEARAILSARF